MLSAMKSFYSILYAGINPASGEKLAVALFMRGADKEHFAWSKHRTNVVRELMGGDAQRLLVQNLKGLQRKCEEGVQGQEGLFAGNADQHAAGGYVLNEPYFNYLTRYSKNLLDFGPVTPIDIEATEQRFNDLFKLLVDDRSSAISRSRSADIDEAKAKLRERISARVNWNAELSQADVPGLLLPSVRLDFIGRNGKSVIGEVVDFEKQEYYLEADINKLDIVSQMLQQQNQLGKAFLVGDEPDAGEHPNQHRAWEAVRASSRIELVPTTDLELVGAHLDRQNVKPWRAN